MTQTRTDPRLWCDDMQTKLMAALDEAWRVIETSDDPAAVAKARAKARLCGEMAATVRKVASMIPAEPRARRAETGLGEAPRFAPSDETPPLNQALIAQAALARLKSGGGRRGRL